MFNFPHIVILFQADEIPKWLPFDPRIKDRCYKMVVGPSWILVFGRNVEV